MVQSMGSRSQTRLSDRKTTCVLGGSCSGGGKECIVCSEERMEHVGVYQYGRDLSVGMKTLQPINSVPLCDYASSQGQTTIKSPVGVELPGVGVGVRGVVDNVWGAS